MENATVIKDRFTSADLEQMPNGFDRYEIIAGELYVSRQPKAEHQYTCNRLGHLLEQWNEQQRDDQQRQPAGPADAAPIEYPANSFVLLKLLQCQRMEAPALCAKT